MNYKERIIDRKIKLKLNSTGALLLEGPKWCGKTTTGRMHCNSFIFLNNPEKKDEYKFLSETSIQSLLEFNAPELIDEWQLIPKIWDAVRYEVDLRSLPGQFILTGSAKPIGTDDISHTGTGRFAWLKMYPMSLYESGESSGEISLYRLFENNQDLRAKTNPNNGLENIAFWACRGGWPLATSLEKEYALETSEDYFNALVNVDISKVDGVNRNKERTKRLMKSYARFQGTSTPLTQIVKDINDGTGDSIDLQTVRGYLNALKNLFVIEDLPAWNPNLKSKTAIRSSDTHYYVDPSIGCAAMGIGPGDLMKDLKTFGFVFESLCIRDLKVYADAIKGEVFHYRDATGLECDAVIHLKDGRYGLIEIKLGGETAINTGIKTLNRLEASINTDRMSNPSFKMVLTAVGDFAYRRPDGVWIVPITTLGV